MRQKRRTEIPTDTAAKVLFLADRTCCVCCVPGKPVQVHHINEDHGSHELRNLAVLCLDCHSHTQVKGGFHRKLSSDQVVLFRDDWNVRVARKRNAGIPSGSAGHTVAGPDISAITSALDILTERKQYEILAIRYSALGNSELRDKYIELALAEDSSDQTVLFLRAMQGKQHLIPPSVLEREVKRRKEAADWSQLARLYEGVSDHRNAVFYYCKSIMESLEESTVFAAAYYLKEMCEAGLSGFLFEESYRAFSDSGDLWWQVRCLQELGWQSELQALLLANRNAIENSGNTLLKQYLYAATGERDKYLQEVKKEAALTKMVRLRDVDDG